MLSEKQDTSGIQRTAYLLVTAYLLAAGLEVIPCWFLRSAYESHCLVDCYFSTYKAVTSTSKGDS